ncbi:MAG TPA: DUF3109 family protein, partial [Rubricoccaceae bacterium]|nr:DUF3109 family protein [Rubricoccaceae bacterium]
MFAVGPVLVSDAVLDAPFACALGKCRGACCVQGVRGAPLEPEERAQLEAALPVVWDRLRPAAQATILREGTWERDAEDGSFAVMTVGGNECVFAVFRGGVAKCAIQEAHREGLLAFPKPISCHL